MEAKGEAMTRTRRSAVMFATLLLFWLMLMGRLTVDIKLSTDDNGVESGDVVLDIQPLPKKEGKAKPESEEATAG
jgi:ATP-dependent Clp protease ATP-binding subunit ClpA